jgi:hypothetical protein
LFRKTPIFAPKIDTIRRILQNPKTRKRLKTNASSFVLTKGFLENLDECKAVGGKPIKTLPSFRPIPLQKGGRDGKKGAGIMKYIPRRN